MQLANRRTLVTGSLGMLAGDLVPLLQQKGARLYLTDIRDDRKWDQQITFLDITQPKAVRAIAKDFQPELIINCAAFTNVDAAETEQDIAFAVNARGPGNLASVARECNAKLLHLSTDYVFGGSSSASRPRKPYGEEEIADPCGIYGHSKRFGDELIRGILPDSHIIVRTSWLHGLQGPNFIDTILKVGAEKDEIKVVDDQFGSPTWSEWLASILVSLIERDAQGTFHATSRGDISWCDLAKEIVKQAGHKARVVAQSTEALGRPAPRPAYSTLDVSKLEKFLGIRCPSWQADVAEHLTRRGIAQ